MPSTRSSAATKCISEVPGLAKQTSTPPATRVRTRLSAPFIIPLPLTLSRCRRADQSLFAAFVKGGTDIAATHGKGGASLGRRFSSWPAFAETASRSRRRFARGRSLIFRLLIDRGRRECRVTTSPMARLQQKKQAAVTTGRAGSTGIPCAMVLRVIRALLGDHRLVATVTRKTREHLRDLSACFGAPEPHDFAVRFRLRSSTHSQSVHRVPLPTSVTTAKR